MLGKIEGGGLWVSNIEGGKVPVETFDLVSEYCTIAPLTAVALCVYARVYRASATWTIVIVF